MSAFSHNPDVNPHWAPKIARRIYRCDKCGDAETEITTNHTGKIWAERCRGKCRVIISPHTEHERVYSYIGPHSYVRDVT
jgi:hypothetical protein